MDDLPHLGEERAKIAAGEFCRRALARFGGLFHAISNSVGSFRFMGTD
jgi:hypothetical protein